MRSNGPLHQVIAMDANFRLRSKLRGAVNKNHTLGPGWSYFVNNGPYSDFIKDYVDQEEVSVLATIDKAQLIYTHRDRDLRRVPSPSQHAHEKIERTVCDRNGGSQLRLPSDVSSAGTGRSAER
jgi:hypothetical protein